MVKSTLGVLMMIGAILMLLVIVQMFLMIKNNKHAIQVSSLESGFESIILMMNSLSSPFMLLAVIFVLFDLEIIFLFPLVPYFNVCMFYLEFLLITVFMLLTLAFEWKYSGLKWQM